MSTCPTSHENIIRIICLVLTAIAHCVMWNATFYFLTASLSIWLTLLVFIIMMAASYYTLGAQLKAGNYVATKLGDAAVPAYMAIRGLFTKKAITA